MKKESFTRTEKQALIQMFQDIIEHGTIIEKLKEKVIQKDDFNLIDAFGMLDEHGRGFVTPTELREQLLDLGLKTSIDEIQLFFERYNSSKEEKLKYSEFQEAIMPFDPLVAKTLGNKRLQYHSRQGRAIFSHDTLSKFTHLLETLL